jgi:hypothetical protein
MHQYWPLRKPRLPNRLGPKLRTSGILDDCRPQYPRPPFVNHCDLSSGTLGYDAANATLLGRGVSLQVAKRWGI